MNKREMTLQITVTVPATTGESEVERAINAALDEPPCDWEDWEVGLASITDVKRIVGDEA
jgi:hypothetical protein